MKTLLFCCAMLLAVTTTRAQMILMNDTFRLEQGLPAFFHIDTTQTHNLWQVGTPSKVFMDSAYSPTKAILTDTANPFPPDNISSFIIHLNFNDTLPAIIGGMGRGSIMFWHKYDFDSLHAGGTLDIRYLEWNNWTPWVNVQLDPHPYFPAPVYTSDTIIGGIPGFTGRSDGWVKTGLSWIWCFGIKENLAIVPRSVELRFTAISDSLAQPTEGWMIDDIYLWIREYWGSIEEANISSFYSVTYPNPTSSDICIKPGIPLAESAMVMVFNATGAWVETLSKAAGEGIMIPSSRYNPGIYQYKITTDSGKTSSGRFIKL